MDNFYEQLENKEKTTGYQIIKTSMYVFASMALFCVLNFLFIPGAFFIILAGLTFFAKKKACVEYEYVFTNGLVDIDGIYEQKKRERLVSFDMRDVELFAESNSAYVKEFSNKPNNKLSYFLPKTDKVVYVAMITGGESRIELSFTPNKEFLELCYKYNPRAVKKTIK